jgi:glycosyltransferase involved in cell wall biosynthesis
MPSSGFGVNACIGGAGIGIVIAHTMAEPFQGINHPPPAVSVILPAHNREALIGRAVTSVLDPSFTDLELIVVDDGSTDRSADAARDAGDERVRILRLPANLGQSAARNAGAAAARAPLLAFQDSDDVWRPGKLARQVAALAAAPTLAMVYGDLQRIPRQGAPFTLTAPDLLPGRIMDHRCSGYAAYGIGIQTCLLRAHVFTALGGFDERMRCFEDLDFFLRLLRRRHRALHLPEPLVDYYETPGVSHATEHEIASRRHLLRQYAWPILTQRPSWFRYEHRRIRNRQRMDLP